MLLQILLLRPSKEEDPVLNGLKMDLPKQTSLSRRLINRKWRASSLLLYGCRLVFQRFKQMNGGKISKLYVNSNAASEELTNFASMIILEKL
jgi:hypothetical protein